MKRVDSTRYGEVENVAVSITDENGVDCWWNPVPGLTAAMLRGSLEQRYPYPRQIGDIAVPDQK